MLLLGKISLFPAILVCAGENLGWKRILCYTLKMLSLWSSEWTVKLVPSLQPERPWDYTNLPGFHWLEVNLYPRSHWAMDKPKGGSRTIKFSCVSIDFQNILFYLSIMLFWLLKLLLLAFRGKVFSFLDIYFANAVRKISTNAFDISKMFSSLPFSLRGMFHLEVTKCCI